MESAKWYEWPVICMNSMERPPRIVSFAGWPEKNPSQDFLRVLLISIPTTRAENKQHFSGVFHFPLSWQMQISCMR